MKLRQLIENKETDVAIIFGRFNPPHKGHRAAWEEIKKNPVWFVGTNKSTIGPKDPLPFDIKIEAMRTIWPEIKGHIVAENSWLTMASSVYKKYPDATLLCYTDEDWVTKTIQQYNGKEGSYGFYNFKNIEQRKTPRLSSATALRDAVTNGDKNAFTKAAGVDANTKVAGKPFFDLVAEYLLPYKKKSNEGVAEADKHYSNTKNPVDFPKTWHDVDKKLGKAVDKMSQAEKVKKGLAHPDTLKKKGVAEAVNTGPYIIYATGPRTMGVNDVDLVFKDLRTGKIVASVVGNNYHPGDDRLQEFAPPDRGDGGSEGGGDSQGKYATYEIRMNNSKAPTYVAFGDPEEDTKHKVYKLGPKQPGAQAYYGHGLTLVSNLDYWSFLEKMLGEIMYEDDAIEAGLVRRKYNGDLVFLNKKQGVAEGLDPTKKRRLYDLIELYRDATEPNDYYDRDIEDPDEVIAMIRSEFGDKIADQVAAGAEKMHYPRHSGYRSDPLGWKKPVDRITKAGKMYKQDSDYIKNTIKSRYALSGKSATEGVAEGANDTIYPNAEVIKSKNGRPVGEIYQDGNSWGAFHYRADRGYDFLDSKKDAIQALKDLHQETGRGGPDYTFKGVAEGTKGSVSGLGANTNPKSGKPVVTADVYSESAVMNIVQEGLSLAGNRDLKLNLINLLVKQDPTLEKNYLELASIEELQSMLQDFKNKKEELIPEYKLSDINLTDEIIMFLPKGLNLEKFNTLGFREFLYRKYANTELSNWRELRGQMYNAYKKKHGMKEDADVISIQSLSNELEETYEGNQFFETYGLIEETLEEAEYQGRKVSLGKPMRGDVKKFKVYVRNPKTGKIVKVNFGDPNMKIKAYDPKRRKSFRARHNCDNPGPRTKARYWSCRKW